MPQFLSNREIYERVVCGIVPQAEERLWIAPGKAEGVPRIQYGIMSGHGKGDDGHLFLPEAARERVHVRGQDGADPTARRHVHRDAVLPRSAAPVRQVAARLDTALSLRGAPRPFSGTCHRTEVGLVEDLAGAASPSPPIAARSPR